MLGFIKKKENVTKTDSKLALKTKTNSHQEALCATHTLRRHNQKSYVELDVYNAVLNAETTESKLAERKHAPKHQASRQTEVGGTLFSFFHVSSSDPT